MFFLHPEVERINGAVNVFDAAGLGLFCVAGTTKAHDYGLGLTASAAEEKYALTGDNTKITFVGTKKGGKHEGGFKKLAGTATVSRANRRVPALWACSVALR